MDKLVGRDGKTPIDTTIDQFMVLARYRDGKSIETIARNLNCTQDTVRWVLKQNGLR